MSLNDDKTNPLQSSETPLDVTNSTAAKENAIKNFNVSYLQSQLQNTDVEIDELYNLPYADVSAITKAVIRFKDDLTSLTTANDLQKELFTTQKIIKRFGFGGYRLVYSQLEQTYKKFVNHTVAEFIIKNKILDEDLQIITTTYTRR